MPAPIDLSTGARAYRVQGHTFALRPTTPANEARLSKVSEGYAAALRDGLRRAAEYRDALIAHAEARQQQLADAERIEDAPAPPMPKMEDYLPEGVDEIALSHRLYFDMFCAVTDGPHDELDPAEFDAKVAEHAIWHWHTEERRRELILEGALPVAVYP